MSLKKILAGALSAGMMLSFIPATAMAANKGWVEQDGNWYYYVSDTECLKDTWKEIDGYWYYFLKDGTMVCDHWAFIGGKLYHFDKRGHMEKNKWVEGREWTDYYYDDQGNVREEKEKKWHFVGSDGAAYSGWKKIGGSWYYFEEESTGYSYSVSDYGLMCQGLRYIGNATYYFDKSGKMQTNCWYQDPNGYWYYFGADGKSASGWKQINGKWYLFDQYSAGMARGATSYWDGYETSVWMLEDSGALTLKTGWVQSRDKYQEGDIKAWYYVKSGGKCCSNEWYKINGKWYYFDAYGRAAMDKSNYLINGKLYDFASSGACKNPDSGRKVTGWQEIFDTWYDGQFWVYGDKSGNIYKSQWLTYGGAKYYFDYEGHMTSGRKARLIDGRIYSFDKDGKATDITGSKKGWLQLDSGRAYIGVDGKALIDWQKIDGKWYYFDSFSGLAATGWWYMNEDEYLFKDNGEMVTGWYDDGDTWYYADSSGKLYKDKWLNYRGSWYYFAKWGSLVDDEDEIYFVRGYGYDFTSEGKCINPDKPRAAIVWD